MLENAYQILEHVSAFSVLLPVIILIIRFKALNKQLWALFLYFLFCIVAERLSLVFLPDEKKQNIVFNCFTIVEFSLLSFIYYHEATRRSIKNLFLVTWLAFILYGAVVYNKAIGKSENSVMALEAGIMILFTYLFIYRFYVDDNRIKPTRHYFFWINLAFLIYFSAAFLLVLTLDYINQADARTAMILWGIHNMIGVASNILISWGVWKVKPVRR